MITEEELNQWKNHGLENGASHLVVMRNQETDDHYPRYIGYVEDVAKVIDIFKADKGEEVVDIHKLTQPAIVPYEFADKVEPNEFSFLTQAKFPNSKFPRTGAEAIYLRRKRSIEKAGYTFEADKKSFGNDPLPLMKAASAYNTAAIILLMQSNPDSTPERIVTERLARSIMWPFDIEFWKPYAGEFISGQMEVGDMIQACLEKAGVFQAAALDLVVDYDYKAESEAWELDKTDPEFPGCRDCGGANH